MTTERKKTKPLITVVTPSFNQGQYIKETIESVLNQDYDNIEYWVIDGGSTDETVDILKSYGDRLHWVSEKDEGQTDAVNKGILRAKGSVIGWLNSDDTYIEHAISTVMDYMMNHVDVDMVYGEGYFIDDKNNIIDRYYTEKFDAERLPEVCYICQPTAFFKKEIVEKVGLLNAKLDLCMDYELWMKIAKVGKIEYIPRFLANSRIYLENKTMSRRLEIHKEVCDTIYKHYDYVPISWIYGYMMEAMYRRRNLVFYFRLLKYYGKYNSRNLKLSLKSLIRAIKRKLKERPSKKRTAYQEWEEKAQKEFTHDKDIDQK